MRLQVGNVYGNGEIRDKMHADYMDILRRVQVAPQWWDVNGTPRFDKFRPEDSPNVYAEECVLLRVRCMECEAGFDVEMNNGIWRGRRVLEALVREGELEYSAPPRHMCRGDCGRSELVRVVEFWKRDDYLVWCRARWLEGMVSRGEEEEAAVA